MARVPITLNNAYSYGVGCCKRVDYKQAIHLFPGDKQAAFLAGK
jgi:hypothetical protein